MSDPKQMFTEELQKLTLSSLSEMGKWIEGAKDFAVEQAPLFAQEYVRWFLIQSTLNMILFAILCIICIWIFKNWPKKCVTWGKQENEEVGYMGGVLSWIFSLGLSVLFGCLAFNCAAEVGKAMFAPRIVIVEGIRDIIKPVTEGK